MKPKDSAGHDLEPGQTVAYNCSGMVIRGKIISITHRPHAFSRTPAYQYEVEIEPLIWPKQVKFVKDRNSLVRNTNGILVIFEL